MAVQPTEGMARIHLSRAGVDSTVTTAELTSQLIEEDGFWISPPLELAGDVTLMVNVSPGAESDREGIRLLREAGIIVSMAHADSNAGHIEECLAAGTTILVY